MASVPPPPQSSNNSAMHEHPVWASLESLLRESGGEAVASRFIRDDDLTPLEFLSACASQAAFVSSWPLKVELLKAAKVAIAQDRKRVFGFAESLFKEVNNSRQNNIDSDKGDDDKGLVQSIQVFAETLMLLDSSLATQALLRSLYDPILTRISDADLAKDIGRRIVQVIENDLGTYTGQKILLYQRFREREETEEGSDTESSLDDWAGTSDSTESSLNERDEGCPTEASAAAAWILAPNLVDPPILSSFGRFSWAHHHARFLMNLPVNTLAARRGLELFASFGAVRFPKQRVRLPGHGADDDDDDGEVNILDDALETIKSAFRLASALQSTQVRDVIASFLHKVEPLSTRMELLKRIVSDETQTPPIRGFALDLIRKQTMENDSFIRPAVQIAVKLLAQPSQEDSLAMAGLSLLNLVGLRARNGSSAECLNVAKSEAVEVYDVVVKVHRAVRELEEEIHKEDTFQLKHEHPLSDKVKTYPAVSSASNNRAPPPVGCMTPQADLGRARLVAGAAEPVIDVWKGFLPSNRASSS